MPVSVTELSIAGRTVQVCGDDADPYFQNVRPAVVGLRPLENWARQNLRPDSIVIDVGGNIGLTALLFSALVPDGHVHIFKALPSNVDILRRNISRNNLTNCTINPVALGNRAGRIEMGGTGSSSHVIDSHAATLPADGAVPIITLDSYMDTVNLSKVEFVKIDVEGFEPPVLEGACRLIERFSPPIFMEFNSWCLTYFHGFSPRDFAFHLWNAFDVATLNQEGSESLVGGGEIMTFLHENMVLHGTIDDVLLRLKPGAKVPSMSDSVPPPVDDEARERIKQLEAELQAILRSTSWQVTKPLRAVRRLADRFRSKT